MRCPICGLLTGEIKDKNGTSYTCTNPKTSKNPNGCTWSGAYMPNDKKK